MKKKKKMRQDQLEQWLPSEIGLNFCWDANFDKKTCHMVSKEKRENKRSVFDRLWFDCDNLNLKADSKSKAEMVEMRSNAREEEKKKPAKVKESRKIERRRRKTDGGKCAKAKCDISNRERQSFVSRLIGQDRSRIVDRPRQDERSKEAHALRWSTGSITDQSANWRTIASVLGKHLNWIGKGENNNALKKKEKKKQTKKRKRV